jgi:DNA primase
MRNRSVLEVNLVDFAKERVKWSRTGKGIMIECPFHDDSSPSMYVTPDYAYCFSCHRSFSPAQFLAKFGVTVDAEIIPTRRDEPERPESRPSAKIIGVAHDALMHSPSKLAYLTVKRGISVDILREFMVGYLTPPFRKYTLPRYVFPAWNRTGELVTASYRQDPSIVYPDSYPENKKYVIHTGSKTMLYGAHMIGDSDWVVYCGGQIDALSLLQYGIPAVGAMGEGVFKAEWASMFHGKKTYILLDNDDAGKLGAIKASKVIPNATILEWPGWCPQKYDINAAINDKRLGIDGIKKILGSN